MATIRSLVVKVGAQTEEIDKALARVGSNAKKTDEELKKLGNTPIGQAAMRSFAEMEAAMNGITKAQQAVADRARLTAAGIDQIGGVTKFTKNELDQLNKTLQSGIDAFRALGQAAPKDLQRVADAVTKQKKALEGTTAQTGLMGQAQSLLTSKVLAFAGPAALGAVVKQSLAYADTLTKMSERTGIGTTALQRMGAVATASGNTLDQVAGAVSKFQAAFAAGKADDVVRSLGLSIAQLKAQSPDEQFFAIAKALQAIEDPAKFAQKATEAFGKGGIEIIPTLKANIDGLKDSTVTMSAESVKALDDFGDMMGRWKVGAVNAIGEVTAAAITLVTNIAKLPAAMRDMQDLSKTSTSVPGLIGGRGVLTDEEIKTMSPEELQRRLQARLRGDRPDVIPKPGATLPGLPTIAAPAGDELDAITKAYDRQQDKLNAIAEANKKTADAAKKAAEAYRAFKNELGIREMENYAAAQKAAAQQIEENVKLEFAMNKLYIANAQAIGMYDSGITLASKNIQPFGLLVAATTKQITAQGQALKFSLGDFLKGGISDLFGGATTVKSGLTNVLGNIGKGLFQGIGNILSGGISGLISGGIDLIGKGFSKLFGRGEKGQVDDIRQALIDQMGGWEGINTAAAKAGVTLARVLNAKTVKDYEAAVNDLNDAIAFQSGAMATLDEITKKYGFTIDELGPAFARQELDKQAQTLFQDFSVLTAAGIDLNTVIAKMGESVNEFAQAAIRTGTQVPEAMRPMIQKMIEMGLLTDASGRKFTSLEDSGITFTETMSEGFSRVVESVEKLTQAIARGLGIALDTVATTIENLPPVDVDVRFNVPDLQLPGSGSDYANFAAGGGRVTAHGIQHFGAGGRVLPFLRRGTDTVPAMLTPGELVLNQGQQEAVRDALAGGGSPGASFKRVESLLEQMGSRAARSDAQLPHQIARYVRDAVQTAKGRR